MSFSPLYFRLWNVVGGADSLTCNDLNKTDSSSLTCNAFNVPDCVDRTVYCTFPPKVTSPTVITLLENHSPYYGKSGGE